MADFRPETTVYMFQSTGVDAENQPFFRSEGAKMAWYMGHQKFMFSEYSYQRENRNSIRVREKANNLRSCDMMAFKNGSGKWILCRITAVEFVNPNTTAVSYEVDSFQTFIEDIEFCSCWVEREMQVRDWNGSVPSFNNLQPEGLETGAFTRTPEYADGIGFPNLSIIVQSVYDENAEEVAGGVTVRGNFPESLQTIVMGINEPNRLSNMIETYAQKGRLEGIQGIYICPSEYVSSTALYNRTETVYPNYGNIDGYPVINAKCYTSEFFHLELNNRHGNSVMLDLDKFNDPQSVVLSLQGAFCGGSGGMILFPSTYPNGKDNGVIVYNDIQIPFVGDTFVNWISQHRYSLLADVFSLGTKAIFGGASEKLSALNQAMSTVAAIGDKTVNPLGVGGQSASNGLPVAIGTYGFLVNWVHPQAPNIQTIDEFFSRFGYRVNRCKVPNVDTRPLWNYVKTAGAIVKGPFNYADKVAIQNAMDNGVTFWHVPAATIGDFSNMAGNKE